MSFVDNGNGTAKLSGTPAASTGGSYPLTITASNGNSPNASQSFTLTVNQVPSITSASSTTFSDGTPGSFTVTTTGFPTPALSETGALPSGVTFVNNDDGTATLAGTPAAGGTYPLSITASNGVSPNASQSFTLTVDQAPFHHLIGLGRLLDRDLGQLQRDHDGDSHACDLRDRRPA